MQQAQRARLEKLEVRQLLTANLVADFNGIFPTDSVTLNGVSYFAANDHAHGQELWKSDGTEAGTTLVKDIVPGGRGSSIINFSVVNGHVLFFARDAANVIGLYTTDGTAAGTTTIKTFGTELPAGYWGAPDAVIGIDGHQKLIFTLVKAVFGDHPEDDTDQGAYSTDGTAGGTVLLKAGEFSYEGSRSNEDWNPLKSSLPTTHGRALFTSRFGVDDLFSSDGTLAGTVALHGVHGEKIGGVLSQSGNDISIHTSYLGADDPSENYYVTDGTQAGTVLAIKFPLPLGGYGNFVTTTPQTAGDNIYGTIRIANQHGGGTLRTELWGYNKTTGTATLLKTVGDDSMDVLASVGDQLIFYASDPAHGSEMWVSDGTVAGTHILQDTVPGKVGSGVAGFLEMGDVTYFMFGGSSRRTTADPAKWELWRTDGTDAGTYALSRTHYNSPSEYDVYLRNLNGKIGMVVEVAESLRTVTTLVYDPTQDTASSPIQGSAVIRNGVLRVLGTDGDDTIRIYNLHDDPSRFVVNINGRTQIISYASVSKTIIYGYAGNDDIGVSHKYGNVVLRSSIWGGSGNDTIYGTDGRDSIYGESGNDDLLGGAGNDIVMGGNGADTLLGSTGSDTMDGGTGNDSVDGGSGQDVLTGGSDSDADTVAGGSGADVVFGQSVLDIFYGSSSADEILNAADAS